MADTRKARPPGVIDVGFAAPPGRPRGVEVITLRELRERAHPRQLSAPQRLSFHLLVAVSEGAVAHVVDFETHRLVPGTWLWVRPEQVHQWGDVSAAEGVAVLFEPEFPDPATVSAAELDDRFAAALFRPEPAEHTLLRTTAPLLASSAAAPGPLPGDAHAMALRGLLAALLLRLRFAAPTRAEGEPNDTFRRFRDAVEAGFRHSHRVADYAHRLGYSPRTLSRATAAATGVSAKEFIDRRVLLEAKRVLAHTDRTSAQVATALGFDSPTNFTKFFRHRTGRTPIAFRASLREPT
ncbi:helix-turn-helix transcriptional regulator [Nocardia puris]|uniref:helix-turn-helix transcriptional regulator n=1 Tax=Nocardia puris TaxID=208602 RepID=UPI001896134A|nr:AraC family transcriptional regulator [Nocardia puris]MBF6213106.1 helix-turn-helix transcriptional regulator [Nocardia puris]MBF6368096.1 helix-turn-helix transcriptional regulator [Nocardia puris]MBF6462730.1 helix-turn-helix transcriptional regulator [Nocardia puris]